MKKSYFLTAVILFLSFATLGAKGFQDISGYAESSYSFSTLSLPSYAGPVTAICQDAQGMVWIGTQRGLFSYDGYSARLYSCDTEELETPIQAILPVSERYLCIAKDVGIRSIFIGKNMWTCIQN